MKILINRSINLSQESRNAWRTAGAIVLPRNNPNRSRVISGIEDNDAVINLGLAVPVARDCVVYNSSTVVRGVISPAALRKTMPDLLPPKPEWGEPCWHKTSGQHGSGARFITNWQTEVQGGDLQKHIEGTEYRVITVGDKVVQATRKDNVQWNNGRHSFDWTWIGLDGARQVVGLIKIAKRAARLASDELRTVFGWDIIQSTDGRVYIIECNSSPGVNEGTARRIVNAIRSVDQ